jgi:hypothetical protein
VKEPLFFAVEGRREPFHGVQDNQGIRNLDQYCALFAQARDEPVVGEASLLDPLLVRLARSNRYRPLTAPETRRGLIEYYREDVLRTQELLQRDLSGWLRVSPGRIDLY